MHIDTLPYNTEFVIIEHRLIEDHKKAQTIAKKSTLVESLANPIKFKSNKSITPSL
jgi:hypothetical protein